MTQEKPRRLTTCEALNSSVAQDTTPKLCGEGFLVQPSTARRWPAVAFNGPKGGRMARRWSVPSWVVPVASVSGVHAKLARSLARSRVDVSTGWSTAVWPRRPWRSEIGRLPCGLLLCLACLVWLGQILCFSSPFSLRPLWRIQQLCHRRPQTGDRRESASRKMTNGRHCFCQAGRRSSPDWETNIKNCY